MNAGRILRAAGLDTPKLRAELAPVDPDEVNVWPASRWWRAAWRKGINGVTLGGVVAVRPELLGGDSDRLARLVVHELVHVRQFRTQGRPLFMGRYVMAYLAWRVRGLSDREAYLAIPAEVEAREVTSRLVP